jgi:hypothetical protein
MASPGDLIDGREAIQRVETRVNAILITATYECGWWVGSRLSRNSAGRKQLINPLVRNCDVFIGLLKRRWGSETGTYSSGFEDEFEVALTRRADGPDPAIGMFFAEVSVDALADPGPQLQSVLKFQKRVRGEHVALYRTFSKRRPTSLTSPRVQRSTTGWTSPTSPSTATTRSWPASPYGADLRRRSGPGHRSSDRPLDRRRCRLHGNQLSVAGGRSPGCCRSCSR